MQYYPSIMGNRVNIQLLHRYILLLFSFVGLSVDADYEYERGRKVAGPLSPLMHQDSAQL